MRLLKYIIYALAAIAAPLWLALNDKKDNNNPKTTIAIDSTTLQQLSKSADNFANQQKIPSSLSIRIDGTHIDSLLLAQKPQTYEANEVQNSLRNLENISRENSQAIRTLLSQDRNVKISVDPISINQEAKNVTNLEKPKDSATYVYDLTDNGPFISWIIFDDFKNGEPWLILNNSSRDYRAEIDSIIPIISKTVDSDNRNTQHKQDAKIIEAQNQLVLNPLSDNRNFYIVGKFIKPRRGIIIKRDTSYIHFKIPVLISNRNSNN